MRSPRCLAAGLAEPDGIVVDAVSGISGLGRGLTAPSSVLSEANENVVAYGLVNHRHTGEIEHALGHAQGGPVTVLFTPHLVPMTRVHTGVYARPAVEGLTTAQLSTPLAPSMPTSRSWSSVTSH